MTSGAARRRRGLFLRVLSVSALIGVGVRSVVGRLVPHGGPRRGALVGALTGLMIAATVGVPPSENSWQIQTGGSGQMPGGRTRGRRQPRATEW